MTCQIEIHVVPLPDGRWGMCRPGTSELGQAYVTRKAAIEAGRRQAADREMPVIIHDETGRISDRLGHGPHPQPLRARTGTGRL